MRYADVQNHVGGAYLSPDVPVAEVHDPSSGAVIARMPLSSARAVDDAVRAARAALPYWSATPIEARVQAFRRDEALLERHLDELAAPVTEEDGRITREARGEVLQSAERTELAGSLPQRTNRMS